METTGNENQKPPQPLGLRGFGCGPQGNLTRNQSLFLQYTGDATEPITEIEKAWYYPFP